MAVTMANDMVRRRAPSLPSSPPRPADTARPGLHPLAAARARPAADGRRGDHPRGRVLQGEPPRLRPRPGRRRAWPRSPSTSAATAPAPGGWTDGRSRTWSRWPRRLRAAIGDERAPLALRGSSMGGYLAIVAAEPAGADAVVAICPASGGGPQGRPALGPLRVRCRRRRRRRPARRERPPRRRARL